MSPYGCICYLDFQRQVTMWSQKDHCDIAIDFFSKKQQNILCRGDLLDTAPVVGNSRQKYKHVPKHCDFPADFYTMYYVFVLIRFSVNLITVQNNDFYFTFCSGNHQFILARMKTNRFWL